MPNDRNQLLLMLFFIPSFPIIDFRWVGLKLPGRGVYNYYIGAGNLSMRFAASDAHKKGKTTK